MEHLLTDAEVVHGTLSALVDDVKKTTELIRRHQEQQVLKNRLSAKFFQFFIFLC